MNCALGWVFWEALRCGQLPPDGIPSLACGSPVAPLSKSLLKNLMLLRETQGERSDSFSSSNFITFVLDTYINYLDFDV